MNLDVLFDKEPYFNKVENVEPGCVLLATQKVRKGQLYQSAVLVTEKDHENGTQGIVVNKQLPLYFNQLNCDDVLKNCFGNAPIFWGGPLEPDWLYFIHDFPTSSSSEFMEGLHFSQSAENIKDLVDTLNSGELNHKYFLRVCLGKCAWREKQLRREIENGYWHLAQMSSEYAKEPSPRDMYDVYMKQPDFKDVETKHLL